MIIAPIIIAKKVTSTVNELEYIEKKLGIATMATTVQTSETASVIALSGVNGKHNDARFKNPVNVSTSTQRV